MVAYLCLQCSVVALLLFHRSLFDLSLTKLAAMRRVPLGYHHLQISRYSGHLTSEYPQLQKKGLYLQN